MEAARQRVRAVTARKKEEEKTKEGESLSAPKAIGKGAAKRKADGKDERSSKKASVTPGKKLPKKPSLPKHGASKRLMMTPGPITQDSERRLLTHKDYAVKMLESIIKEKEADPCIGQATGELGDSGLYDLTSGKYLSFFLLLIHFHINQLTTILSCRHRFI